MQIEDLKPTARPIDDTPRPKASQAMAAAKRARQGTPITPARTTSVRRYVPFGVGAIVLIVAILATQQSLERAPLAITPVVTVIASPTALASHTALLAAPTRTGMLVSDTTVAPIAPQNGAHEATVVSEEVLPQSGRGPTLAVDAAVATPELEPAPEPNYIANVGQQAPHTIRSGATGPCDGACAIVPTAPPAMLQVIGQQAPHKVR